MQTIDSDLKSKIKIIEDKDSVTLQLVIGIGRCAVDASKFDNEVILNRLIVHHTLRRNGIAKLLMEEFCGYLDRNKYECVLGVESDDLLGMNDDLLIEFYRRYGFISDIESKYFMRRVCK